MASKPSRRVPKQLNPPSLDEDPAERKRQLNILAQRRYRQRKREHLQRLEHSAASQRPDSILQEPSNSTQSVSSCDVIQAALVKDYTSRDFSTVQLESTEWSELSEQMSLELNGSEIFCFDSSPVSGYDTALDFALPSVSISTVSSSSKSPSSPNSDWSLSNSQRMSRDELHLPMRQMTLLRGFMLIAKRLEVEDIVFDLSAQSPFCLPNNTSLGQYTNLPANLRPTVTQLSTPHHPALDLLPWPDVRDKLIGVFAQPMEFRPPNARSPTAFAEFVYDFEDASEGARIYGDDPYIESNWEIGEKVFDRWWWALSGNVVIQANIWRGLRGVKLLGEPVR